MSKVVYKFFEMYIYRVDLVVKDICMNIIILFIIFLIKKLNFIFFFLYDFLF